MQILEMGMWKQSSPNLLVLLQFDYSHNNHLKSSKKVDMWVFLSSKPWKVKLNYLFELLVQIFVVNAHSPTNNCSSRYELILFIANDNHTSFFRTTCTIFTHAQLIFLLFIVGLSLRCGWVTGLNSSSLKFLCLKYKGYIPLKSIKS